MPLVSQSVEIKHFSQYRIKGAACDADETVTETDTRNVGSHEMLNVNGNKTRR